MGDLGGGDWREAAAEEAPAGGGPDHLVVMVHGIVGSAADWKFGAEQFDKLLSDRVIVHCSNRNMHKLTLDGIDVMGERLAQEVIEEINRRPQIKRISFVAHSVGGLVARYAIGRLYRPLRQELESAPESLHDNRGNIHGLEAVNFITVASPHLGSRGNKQVPFLFGVTAIENFACCIIHLIFGKTGKHLFLTDNDDGKPPLLQRMVDGCGELQFMSALQAFKRRVAYSNVGYDHIVGWRTSSIRGGSELPNWIDSVSKIYPHIVYEELSKAETPGDVTDVDKDNCTLEGLHYNYEYTVDPFWENKTVPMHVVSFVSISANFILQLNIVATGVSNIQGNMMCKLGTPCNMAWQLKTSSEIPMPRLFC